MVLAGEGEGEVGGDGRFANATFGRGDGNGVADRRNGPFGGEAAFGAWELWGSVGARETLQVEKFSGDC